jgi:adenylate cyclase class 2
VLANQEHENSSGHNQQRTASKLQVQWRVIQALQQQGYVCIKPRTLMQRRTFTLKEKPNASIHEWARVRDEGDKITMTYKRTHHTNSALGTEEIDLTVSDFDSAFLFMENLGFKDFLVQENYREAWEKDGLQVTLDEWPVIGRVVELEGPTEAELKSASAALGFDYSQAIFGGIGNLYFAKYRKDMGLVKELTFANEPIIQKFLEQTNEIPAYAGMTK